MAEPGQTTIDLDSIVGPPLPGSSDHDVAHPSPADLHALDHQVTWLLRNWYDFAPVAEIAGYNGISLAAAVEYLCMGPLSRALVDARFPGHVASLSGNPRRA